MSTWDEALQEWRSARELADVSAAERAWIEGHYPDEPLDVTTHADLAEPRMMAVEDDEPRPDKLGPTLPDRAPDWFIVVVGLVIICCGASGVAALIMWIAGVFS